MKLKQLVFILPVMIFGLTANQLIAQKVCCSKSKDKASDTACCDLASASISSSKTTSGCAPSACRGAKTKFGEAQVIIELRENLIALKTEMENSSSPKFKSRAYDIHGIIGNSDDESLAIIVKELQIIELAFANSLEYERQPIELPDNKAKQVVYLNDRIANLQTLL